MQQVTAVCRVWVVAGTDLVDVCRVRVVVAVVAGTDLICVCRV